MTDWIDFAVYATFLVAIFFAYPTTQQRLAVSLLGDRNPEWVAAHPEIVRRIAQSRWRLWLGYALGSVSLCLLAALQLGLWEGITDNDAPATWKTLWILTMLALWVGVIVAVPIEIARHFAVKRLVPLAMRRQATLERRSLDDFVPRWVQLVTYGLVAAHLAGWVGAGMLGMHSDGSPMFWVRTANVFFTTGFFFFVTSKLVARRANAMDRIFGPTYRRWEARYTFSMQIYVLALGAPLLYEQVTDTKLLDLSRAIYLLSAAFIAYGFLRVARLPIDGPPRESQPSATLAHT